MMTIKKRIGHYIKSSAVGGETYNAYIPPDLPFKPSIDMPRLYPLLERAHTALGRLDGMNIALPEASDLLYDAYALMLSMYTRKEAVLSSQIEGTQSSLSDLLLFENEEIPGVSHDDADEVARYVSALNYGLERLKELPLSLRLIREIHKELMQNTRGKNKRPGEFRKSQNWIGGTRPGNAIFVPPPPEHLKSRLNNFEKFLHNKKIQLPTLIKAAIAHVQFETIHPFLDGNGRLGRLLITFILCNERILKKPILYLSFYFKSHRQLYYEHLQSIRETGDWEAWIEFFLEGVEETANHAMQAAQDIIALFRKDREIIERSGKSTAAVLAVHSFLQRRPRANTTKITSECNISLPTALRSLKTLEELDIIQEVTGKERHKIFAYSKYIAILNQGTDEPFPN